MTTDSVHMQRCRIRTACLLPRAVCTFSHLNVLQLEYRAQTRRTCTADSRARAWFAVRALDAAGPRHANCCCVDLKRRSYAQFGSRISCRMRVLLTYNAYSVHTLAPKRSEHSDSWAAALESELTLMKNSALAACTAPHVSAQDEPAQAHTNIPGHEALTISAEAWLQEPGELRVHRAATRQVRFWSTCHTQGKFLKNKRIHLAVPVRNMLSLAAKRRNHITCMADSTISMRAPAISNVQSCSLSGSLVLR